MPVRTRQPILMPAAVGVCVGVNTEHKKKKKKVAGLLLGENC